MSSPGLPNVRQQLQQLTPTDSLMEFYQSKIDNYEQEMAEFANRLDEYRLEHEQQFETEKRLREALDQIDSLRESLSSANTRLFCERERILLLKTENSALKMREASDRKTIHYLLTICGIGDEETVAILLNNDVALRGFPCCFRKDEEELRLNTRTFAIRVENEILRLEIESTKALLTERAELSLCEREALVNEHAALLRDFENRKASDAASIDDLTRRLRKAQSALNNQIRTGKRWTSDRSEPIDEKSPSKSPRSSNKTKVTADADKQQIRTKAKNARAKPAPHMASRNDDNLEQKLRSLQSRCEEKEAIIAELRDELLRLRRFFDGKPAETVKQGSLAERVRMLTARNKDLERRRKLDLEGFKTDIRFLRDQLKDIERQLLKAVLNLGSKHEDVDFSSLEAIENTAKGSQRIAVKLKDLMARLEHVKTSE